LVKRQRHAGILSAVRRTRERQSVHEPRSALATEGKAAMADGGKNPHCGEWQWAVPGTYGYCKTKEEAEAKLRERLKLLNDPDAAKRSWVKQNMRKRLTSFF
jgi:hypothetical protein